MDAYLPQSPGGGAADVFARPRSSHSRWSLDVAWSGMVGADRPRADHYKPRVRFVVRVSRGGRCRLSRERRGRARSGRAPPANRGLQSASPKPGPNEYRRLLYPLVTSPTLYCVALLKSHPSSSPIPRDRTQRLTTRQEAAHSALSQAPRGLAHVPPAGRAAPAARPRPSRRLPRA